MHAPYSPESSSAAQGDDSSAGRQPVVRRNSSRMAVDALAGAISGCISRIVVGPLDVIKIRFQVRTAFTAPPMGHGQEHYPPSPLTMHA